MKIKIINTTTDSKKVANRIADLLIKDKLSPCVQVIQKINSTYKFKNNIKTANEYLLIVKTVPKNVLHCKEYIQKHHNYSYFWKFWRGSVNFLSLQS